MKIEKDISGDSLVFLKEGWEISRTTLWLHRLLTVVFFGAWAYSMFVWPTGSTLAGLFVVGLGLLWYVGGLKILSRDATTSKDSDGEVSSSHLIFMSSGRRISKGRIWTARLLWFVAMVFGYGAMAAATPGRWIDATSAPITALLIVLGVIAVYPVILYLLSREA